MIAGKERSVSRVVVENFPRGVSPDRGAPQNGGDAECLRELAVDSDVYGSILQELGERFAAERRRRFLEYALPVKNGSFRFDERPQGRAVNSHRSWVQHAT